MPNLGINSVDLYLMNTLVYTDEKSRTICFKKTTTKIRSYILINAQGTDKNQPPKIVVVFSK